MNPRIAIITFPGTNGDTENLRTFWRCGFDAFVFRWNDSKEKLRDVDGYFIGAGFSYEDRGRSGMVAARDPLFQFLHEEAAKGKVVLGNCNGAQVLVESGLIPLGEGLRMSLAKNAVRKTPRLPAFANASAGRQDSKIPRKEDWVAPGFLNEWIWITPSCKRDRCATADWAGAMQIPMAHGEGRFVTKDPELIAALEENDQVAFRYCDASGKISEDPSITLNGSTKAIAGICNPQGNVVALMPHPERTVSGDPYFLSVRKWIERNSKIQARSTKQISSTKSQTSLLTTQLQSLLTREPKPLEIFIDTIIVNNEERTVEAAAKRVSPTLTLKQFRYLAPTERKSEEVLTHLSLFNPNKERAYVRRGQQSEWFRWNAEKKILESTKSPLSATTLLRRDEPDTGASGLGEGSESGVCYVCNGITEQNLCSKGLQEIFGNSHASTLERIL